MMATGGRRFEVRARGRLRAPGGMNKTEERYALELERRRIAGDVAWWRFQGMTFKLADDTRYTPDFNVMRPGGEIEQHEVKGFWRDDALVKIKVAASLFPFTFIAVRERPRRDGGGWDVEVF